MASGDIALRMFLSATDLASSVVVSMSATYDSSLVSMSDSTLMLNDYLASLGDQLFTTGAGFDGMAASVDASAASLDVLDGSLAGVNASAASAATSLDAVATSATATDAALASVDASAAGTDTALASTAAAADASALSMKNAAVAQKAVTDNASKFKALGMGLLVMGAAAVGTGVLAVKMAGDFQAGMTSLVTGAGESQSAIGTVSDGILRLSVDTGQSTKSLTDGMYLIESAGYHAANGGLDVLAASARGAAVGSASLADVANGVTTAMTDYKTSNLTAAQATNDLIATVAAGKTHMGDLARSMSNILPVASATGVSFGDVSAAMATMTGEGTSAQLASTYLKQVILALTVPSKGAAAALKGIGLTTAEVASDMKKSLPDTLALITNDLAKKFPVGSAAYTAGIKAISGGSKNMMAMLELTGSHMSVFRGNLTAITGSVKQGGTAITGWTQVQGDFNTKVEQAKAAGSAFMIMLGTELLPVFSKLVTNILPIVTNLMTWEQKTHTIQNAIAGLVTAIVNVVTTGAAIVSFFQHNQAALVALGVALVIAAGIIGGLLVAALVSWAVAAWAAAIAMIAATWPFMLIGAAIALLIVGIILLVQHWGQVVSFLRGIWQAFASWFMGALHAVGAFFASIWSGISSFFLGVWNGIVAGVRAAWAFIVNIIKVGIEVVLIILFAPIILIAALFIWLYQHNTYFQMLIDAIVGFVKAGIAWLMTAWHNVIQWIVGAWQYLVTAATMYFMLVYVTIQSKVQQVQAFLVGIWNNVVSFLAGIWKSITAKVGEMWTGISTFFSNAWSTYVQKPLQNLWNGIVNFINGWPKQMVQFGINMIQGFINGMLGMIGNVGHAAGQIMGSIGKFLGFHSPAAEGEGQHIVEWGENLVKGFVGGMQSAMPLLNAQVSHMIQAPGTMASSSRATNNAFALSGGQTIVVQVQPAKADINMDGKKVGDGVMKYAAKEVRIQGGVRNK